MGMNPTPPLDGHGLEGESGHERVPVVRVVEVAGSAVRVHTEGVLIVRFESTGRGVLIVRFESTAPLRLRSRSSQITGAFPMRTVQMHGNVHCER